ncbi:MAG: hypothetical protein ACK4S0_13325 [Sediminibacterium sp.]
MQPPQSAEPAEKEDNNTVPNEIEDDENNYGSMNDEDENLSGVNEVIQDESTYPHYQELKEPYPNVHRMTADDILKLSDAERAKVNRKDVPLMLWRLTHPGKLSYPPPTLKYIMNPPMDDLNWAFAQANEFLNHATEEDWNWLVRQNYGPVFFAHFILRIGSAMKTAGQKAGYTDFGAYLDTLIQRH